MKNNINYKIPLVNETKLSKVPSTRRQRDEMVKYFIKNKIEPSVENLKTLLHPDIDVNLINENIINICLDIYNNSITIPIPKVNNYTNKYFLNIIKKINKILNTSQTPGCYIIHNGINNDKYIGRSIDIKSRIRQHSGQFYLGTTNIIKNFNNNGLLTLFILPRNICIINHIFLIILEQYLFIKIRPTKNKNYISTTGNVPIVKKTIYVYFDLYGKYYLIYQGISIIDLCGIFGIGSR